MSAFRFATAALVTLSLATPLAAHVRLMSTTPATNSTAGPTKRVELHFARKVSASSNATVARSNGPGMKAGRAVDIPGKTSLSADGKTLAVAFANPLPQGNYTVTWHVQTGDQHRMQGRFAFAVK